MKVSVSSAVGGGGGGGCGVDVDDDLFGDPKAWPPGFRFHPTDEELILYYLKRKICRRRLLLNVIADIDVYKWDPEELPGQSVLKSGDRQWYFFSPRDRKYPNGARSNRATRHGYWKATGKDRHIEWNSRLVGSKKTLVFYRGRAPQGARTDWVMHEYTMDEEEIQRCKSAQDCYALYKLYKKSGPGPKNGEQYGAPFREEEWADDSDLVEDNQQNQAIVCNHLDNNESVKSLADNQSQRQVDLFNEILGLIEDGPEINKGHENAYAYDQSKVGAVEEIHNRNMGPSLGVVTSTEPSVVLPTSLIHLNAEHSFNATHSTVSCLVSRETPEVTSAPINMRQLSFEEDSFLEMDDLMGPPPTFSDVNKASDNLVTEESYGLDDPEVYFDAAMFLRDMGSIDQGATSHPYINGLGSEEAGSLDYQMQTQLNYNDEAITTQLWMHEQRPDAFIPSQSNQVVLAPQNSGFSQSGGSVNLPSEERQNQGNNEGDDTDTWFSSAISDFLDSIPTRPALASENALIHRAFERMSSFGRVRITTRDTDVAAGVGPAVVRRNATRKGGFLFLSVLGAVCAISWLLMIGTTVKVLKTFFGRFVS